MYTSIDTKAKIVKDRKQNYLLLINDGENIKLGELTILPN